MNPRFALSPAGRLWIYIILAALGFSLSVRTVRAQTAWVDSARQGSEARFLFSNTVRRFNLATQSWLTAVTLPRSGAVAMAWDSQNCFIAYGTAIYRYAPDLTGEQLLATAGSPAVQLLMDGNLLIVLGNNGSFSRWTVFNRTSGAQLSDVEYTSHRFPNGVSIAPSLNKYFGRNKGVSPEFMEAGTYTDAGVVNQAARRSTSDSSPDATRTWVMPGETRVLDSAGSIFTTKSLASLGSLSGAVTDVAFNGDVPVVLRGNQLIAYANTLQETGTKTLTSSTGLRVLIEGTNAFVFQPGTPNPGVQTVTLAELSARPPGQVIDPVPLIYRPDDVFLDKNGVAGLYSRFLQRVFRWSPALRAYDASVTVPDFATHICYSPESHLMYMADETTIKKIAPTPGASASSFVELSMLPRDMIAFESNLYIPLLNGLSTYSPQGVRLSNTGSNNDVGAANTWDPVRRRVYHFSDVTSPIRVYWDIISTGGQISVGNSFPPTPTAIQRYAPIVVSPDGNRVVIGDRYVFDAGTQQVTNNLNTRLMDMIWFGGRMVSLESGGGGTLLQTWTTAFARQTAINLTGSPLRLFQVTPQQLLVITMSGSRPRFFLYGQNVNLTFDSMGIPEVSVLDGPATNSPAITDGQTSVINFGTARRGTPVVRSFTIRNTGTFPLTVTGLTAPAGYTLLSPLPATVELNESITIEVRLDATAVGTYPGSLSIANNDPDEGPYNFPVTGVVVTPEIEVHDGLLAGPELNDGQAAVVDFGIVRQASPAVRSITVSSRGTAPLLISSVTAPAGYTFINLPALPATVEINTSLTLQLQLVAAAPGTFAGRVTITSDDLDEADFDFPVTGTVVTPEIVVKYGPDPGAELADGQEAAVNYGIVRQAFPQSKPFSIANTGTAPLRVSAVNVPAGYTALDLPALPVLVEVSSTLPFRLRVDAAALGTFAGTIAVESDDLDEATFNFPVTATVVSPEITVHSGGSGGPELTDGQAAPFDFGRNVQGTPGDRLFAIGNAGTAELLVSAITAPPGYTLLNPPALPVTIPVGQSAAFQVSLTTLTVGTHTGSVMIASDDLDEASFDFPISGEVYIPDPVATLPASTAGLNRQTGLREQTVRLTNDTTATVPAYNLIIRGLPAGVEVNNASDHRADGSWVVYVRQAMNPHTAQDILLEYFSPTRLPGEFTPQLSTEVVLVPPDLSVPGEAAAFRIDVVKAVSGGVLIEFPTNSGSRYQVQYSSDGTNWQSSLPSIRAAANRTQWVDRGLPRTDSPPAAKTGRFYRVAELSP